MSDGVIRVGPGFRREFPGAEPSAAEAAANLVHVATAFLDEVQRRRVAIARLSPSAFQALAVLDGAGEPLPSNVMAERLVVTTASATSLVDTLERNGLVTREAHPTDRRKVMIAITPAGSDIVDRMLPIVHAAATEAFSTLSEDQRQGFIDALGRVQQQVGRMSESDPKPPRPRRKPAST